STWDGNDSSDPVEQVPEIDSRAWHRFPSKLYSICYPGRHPAGEPRPCRVVNICATGINLVLDKPVEAGVPLTVQLPGLVPGFEAAILTQVSHVLLTNEGEWSIGCTFAR